MDAGYPQFGGYNAISALSTAFYSFLVAPQDRKRESFQGGFDTRWKETCRTQILSSTNKMYYTPRYISQSDWRRQCFHSARHRRRRAEKEVDHLMTEVYIIESIHTTKSILQECFISSVENLLEGHDS
ncbi:hypothetical protein PV10_04510 [Exophiala mesophila]|uniref:Uncharacterized protein n=1 Tax=Exophiala mesophila TaxID=212818 RepID=A0A0D1ZHI5_EXOME|nr:uncharacterized protein PV10_04510 [Exophiala mesophila]KIV93284.1 hypothetical protein PV10_04510 [Exophiala mesophila]